MQGFAACEIQRVMYRFSDCRYEPMAQYSQATWVPFQQGAEILCSPLAILRGTQPVRALIRELFILLRSL